MEPEKSPNRKWIFLALGLVACAALGYGLSKAGLLSSIHSMIDSFSENKAQPESKGPQARDSKDQAIQDQERIAKSIAEQQAVAQQNQIRAQQSLAEVQKTLKSIEEINRMNRQNQQMRNPKQ